MTIGVFNLWELRYRRIGGAGSYTDTFTAGNDAGWNSATKLRAFDCKLSLPYGSEKDRTAQTRANGRPANIPTDRAGATIEFSMWLEGGSSTVTPPTLATLLGYCLGGLRTPTAISDTAEAASAVNAIVAASHGQVAGDAVLVGTRGDGYADGRVSYVDSVDSVNKYWLRPNLPGVPQVGHAVKHGHTVYFDRTVENYLEFLLIGHYAGSGVTDDADQVNAIGCSCAAVTISNLKQGSNPIVTLKFNVGDWRNEPYATKASLQHTTAGSGGGPAGNLSIGQICIGDASSYTRTAIQGGDFEIAPNITLEKIADPAKANGCGGWVSMPSDTGPTCSVTRYWGDMPGMYDDFVTPTAKHLVAQWGHTAEHTVAFGMQRCYFDNVPERVEFAKSMALKLALHGDSGQTTNESTADFKLQDSPMWISFL